MKEDVVNMVKTGDKSIGEISRDLEIAETIIYRWYKKITGNNGMSLPQIVDTNKIIIKLIMEVSDGSKKEKKV